MNNKFNINFSLDFMESVDIDNMIIFEGLFSGFKFSLLNDGVVFFKNIDGMLVSTKISNEEFSSSNHEEILKNINQMSIQKETTCIDASKSLDENMILRSFIGKFADECAEKIWTLALNNFKCKDAKRRVFNFNKRSIPEEMLHMPAMFYEVAAQPLASTEETVLNLNDFGFKKVEKIAYHEKVNNVLQEIEQSIGDNVCARCKEFEKQEAKHMDNDAQLDLEDQVSLAINSFFKVFEKNVKSKDINK